MLVLLAVVLVLLASVEAGRRAASVDAQSCGIVLRRRLYRDVAIAVVLAAFTVAVTYRLAAHGGFPLLIGCVLAGIGGYVWSVFHLAGVGSRQDDERLATARWDSFEAQFRAFAVARDRSSDVS